MKKRIASVGPYQDGYARPMPLALADGLQPMIRSRLALAFVNPYSKNADPAVAYLEAAAGELSGDFLANACPNRNEPIKDPYCGETVAYFERQIASIQAELERAAADDRGSGRRSPKSGGGIARTARSPGRGA